MDLGKVIAINLKALRSERNLTLGQLAKISGVSKTMLSDIEKGDSNPTINTIWKIAGGLNIPYTRLMEEIESETMVVRKSSVAVQTDESEHYRIHCYFKNTPLRNFEFFQVELDAHSENETTGHLEKTQEYIYVVQGGLVLRTELEEYTLQAGDALVFDASVRHTYINRSDVMVSFIVLNFYPNYF